MRSPALRQQKETCDGVEVPSRTEQGTGEAGLYPAALASIELREGTHGPFLVWKFDVEVNGDKVPVSLPSSTKFTSGANGRKYAEALLGRHLADEEELDLEELYGAPCQVLVTIAKMDGGGTVNRIEKVLAAAPESSNGEVSF